MHDEDHIASGVTFNAYVFTACLILAVAVLIWEAVT